MAAWVKEPGFAPKRGSSSSKASASAGSKSDVDFGLPGNLAVYLVAEQSALVGDPHLDELATTAR